VGQYSNGLFDPVLLSVGEFDPVVAIGITPDLRAWKKRVQLSLPFNAILPYIAPVRLRTAFSQYLDI